MIKLFDNINLLDKISLSDPYLGPIFTANGAAFINDPDLINIWVELDEHGTCVSAAMIDQNSAGVICGKKGIGNEMILFVSNVLQSGSQNMIIANEFAFPQLSLIFSGDVSESRLMKCSKHLKYDSPNLMIRETETFDDLMTLFRETNAPVGNPDMYKLTMVRGKKLGLIKAYTLFDGDIPVSSATIRGISPKAGAIANVMTIPSYRHHGYASFLTAYCHEKLKLEGRISTLEPADEYAYNLYKKLGYTEYSKKYTIKLKKDK